MIPSSNDVVVNRPAASAEAAAVHPAEVLATRFEGIDLGEHPLFSRLRREPINRAALWLILSNMHAGVGPHLTSWLAHVVHAVDDERIRCIIVKQLSDELGDGDLSRMHKPLYDRFIDGIASWRPSGTSDASFAPGRALHDGIASCMTSPDAYCGVGAILATEIYAKKFDICLAEQIDRQSELSDATLEWLRIHLALEPDHAGSSLTLAHLLPASGPKLASALRGAEGFWEVGWAFLDQMYRVIYAH